jgi:UDP-glucose:(heptosyl)LPS alpha-1,3-glucosyltransferase
MRIAVLSRNFSTSAGGAERYAIAIVDEMVPQHEVHVFCQTRDYERPHVVYRKVPRFFARPRWLNQLFFSAYTWVLTHKQFDVVHSHENTWHGDVQTAHVLPVRTNRFARLRGWRRWARWLQTLSSPRLLAYLWLETRRFAVQPQRCVVCVSRSLLEVMQQAFPAAAASMQVLAPGLRDIPGRASATERLAARRTLGVPENVYCLLFIGRQIRKKGLPALLQALQTLGPRFYLLAIGSEENESLMHDWVSAAALEGRVRILGSLSQIELAYRAADCLVHPTLEDTYAMVVLEAMSHGLPVIVSSAQYCGISAELEDGVNALILTKPQSALELTKGIERVAGDPALGDALGRAGLTFASQRSWKKVAADYQLIYQRIFESRHGSQQSR